MKYTSEKSQLMLLSLLKSYGIKKVIASAGTTNFTLVMSMQDDPWFEMYSSVDERSAAYIACGLASESNEPVVITCTEATASRNYLPGLTEAYYRKLPILAVTGSHGFNLAYHRVPQSIDRMSIPRDVANLQVNIPFCRDKNDEWDIMINLNRALTALTRHGGGPVHINLESKNSKEFTVKELPIVRKIRFVTYHDSFPEMPRGSIVIFCGVHKLFSEEEIRLIDSFCERYNAVVFCDHTSNYFGKYKVNYSIVLSQEKYDAKYRKHELIIHIGETSGDYYSLRLIGNRVWRVSEDGEFRDLFHGLECVFEMPETHFFDHYVSKKIHTINNSTLNNLLCEVNKIRSSIPELPFSNLWIAQSLSQIMPKGCIVHFSILNSLRTWNFFDIPNAKSAFCNVGGFGIDGSVSTLLGASLVNNTCLHFLITGDLAFFYDMNALGNRHVSSNIRIILINNGKGNEFRLYWHPAAQFGVETDKFVGGGSHYGNKSNTLVKDYVESLGFEYLSATTKEEFLMLSSHFVDEKYTEKPILFEVFTTTENENEAIYKINNSISEGNVKRILVKEIKKVGRNLLGDQITESIKNKIRK